ncbi:TetR/AcrR family transcriptional regulator [Mycolicibacterium septicum]|uniref:TetR/AcrR family transcriptional regulator n=1 Tax=Mycolicibacterium septicum TaxID=98668 RepID=UPI00235DF0BF|nr:helix-turn-helix domain-containing protein [Mycolicibacterium septicum]
MPRDGGPTREKLLDAALKLWAVRGLEGTTLADINEAAGQRNTSAIQYHFDGRDGLIRAIYARFVPGVIAHHEELLERARTSRRVRPAAEAIVLPLGKLLTGDWRDRAFVELLAQMFAGTQISDPQWVDLVGIQLVRRNGEGVIGEVDALILDRIAPLPPPLGIMRLTVASHFVARSLADFARHWDKHGPQGSEDPELFISNLVDMFIATLTAPVSASSSAVLATVNEKSGRRSQSIAAGARSLRKRSASPTSAGRPHAK